MEIDNSKESKFQRQIDGVANCQKIKQTIFFRKIEKYFFEKTKIRKAQNEEALYEFSMRKLG